MSRYHGSIAQRHTARRAAENIAAGRAWIAGHYFLDITDEEIAGLRDEEVMEEINRLYEGGWQQFVADRVKP